MRDDRPSHPPLADRSAVSLAVAQESFMNSVGALNSASADHRGAGDADSLHVDGVEAAGRGVRKEEMNEACGARTARPANAAVSATAASVVPVLRSPPVVPPVSTIPRDLALASPPAPGPSAPGRARGHHPRMDCRLATTDSTCVRWRSTSPPHRNSSSHKNRQRVQASEAGSERLMSMRC